MVRICCVSKRKHPIILSSISTYIHLLHRPSISRSTHTKPTAFITYANPNRKSSHATVSPFSFYTADVIKRGRCLLRHQLQLPVPRIYRFKPHTICDVRSSQSGFECFRAIHDDLVCVLNNVRHTVRMMLGQTGPHKQFSMDCRRRHMTEERFKGAAMGKPWPAFENMRKYAGCRRQVLE